jgi:hypothetical protein
MFVRVRRLLVVLVVASALARGATAQDAHYWSETYGTYATLLGGVVVGKVPDISATFYNPGRLAFATNPAFALTTRVYELRSNQLDINGTSYGTVELGNLGVKPSPSFAAGLLPVGDRQQWVVAYTILARQADEEQINADATTGTANGTTSAELYYRRTASEYWMGLSAGYRLSARTGVGATLFGTYHSQSQRGQLRIQSLGTAPPPDAADRTRQFSYYQAGLLAKLGISTQLGSWYLGASVTTPTAGLFGSGKILTTEVSTSPAAYAWRSQEDLSPDYRTPWLVAAGITRTFGTVTAYATAEWAGATGRSALLDADSVVPADGRPPYDDDVYFARQEVLNWGLGLEIRRSPTRAFYVHVKTDRSARPEQSGIDATYARWDRYHAGGGYAFRLGQWDLVAGLVYTWASDSYVSGEVDPPPDGFPLPPGATAEVREARLRFLFGFNVRF